MKHTFIAALAVLSVYGFGSSAFARGGDDGAFVDLTGKAQDVIQKSGGADNVGIDLRGKGQDTLLKRGGADNVGIDLRGKGQDTLQKRHGADDPVNHIRRARGADDMRQARHR